jgi:Flp pilus assembly protein TadG
MSANPTTRPGRRGLKGDGGQNMVEFALVVPLFLLLVMAIVDFGWMFRTYISETNCAREGARLGIVDPRNTSAIQTRATSTANGCVAQSTATVTCSPDCKAGSNITVQVKYTYNYITPLGGLLNLASGGTLPSKVDLSSSATMRIE